MNTIYETRAEAEDVAVFDQDYDDCELVECIGGFKFVKRPADNAIASTTQNTVLDNETHHCTVDLLRHVSNNHIIKRLTQSIANATDLPPSTVFLNGLGLFSSIACRQWRVNYQHSGSIPIGLYIVTEQPSGTGKSRSLKTYQQPFESIHFENLREIKKALELETEKKEIDLLYDQLKTQSFVTNPTPEALEESLNYSNGFFSAVSSEQGLFNSLLGLSYGDSKKANNNDLMLNAFDGGFVNSIRVNRDGYRGLVGGGVVLFAQQGSVEKVLSASNGTGLAERFLMLAESHNLGRRDWNKPRHIDNDCVNEYAEICKKVTGDIFLTPKSLFDLPDLTIDRDGWRLINDFRNKIEPHLIDGGKYSHSSLRGAAGKVDMQIMKIAANLQLLDGIEPDYNLNAYIIANNLIQTAIAIVADLLDAHLSMLKDKGLIGTKAEYSAILSIFEKDNRAKTFEQIRKSRITVEPFKSHTGNKSELVKTTLHDMVADGILSVTPLDGGGLSYGLIR